mmetsp:Transcript_47163/g.54641  ORF Transcript_47163/g.54641 Transcript_47163/m.54641 type:complete len:492 (+) Transcript_47163:38-1513(+)
MSAPTSSSASSSSSGAVLGSQPDPKKFAKWAKERNIFLHPDVAYLVPTKTMGSGVYAMRPIKKGSTVVTCPLASCLNPYETRVTLSPCITILEKLRSEGLDTVSTLCLRLMAELSRHASLVRPWLECCPRMDDHIFDLPQETIQRLLQAVHNGHVFAWSNVGQQYEELNVEGLWTRVKGAMDLYPSIWPPSNPNCSKGGFYQALAQIWSRNFHREEVKGQEGPYMLPGIDLINHNFKHCNTDFTMHGGGRSRELTFDVMANRDIQKGEQIYCNYGNMIEARFFLEFQFINGVAPPAEDSAAIIASAHNPHDALRFSRAALASLCAAVSSTTSDALSFTELRQRNEKRLSLLHDFSLIIDEGLFVKPIAKEEASSDIVSADVESCVASPSVEIPQDLWNIVYVLTCLDDSEFNDTKSKLTRHWRCPKSAALMRNLATALRLRLDGVMANLQAVEEVLTAPDFDQRRYKRALLMLTEVLRGEVNMLKLLLKEL